MPASIAIPQIVDAAMRGIDTAQKDFEKWTGGDSWLEDAPEYLSTVYVARELARLKGKKYLYLEVKPKDVLKDAHAVVPGPVPKGIREKGRVDIVLYWGNGYPRAPIELKGWVRGYETIAADMKRLEGLIHHGADKSKLQFGLMAFYTATERNSGTSTAEEQLAKWICKIEAKARNAMAARTTTLECRSLPVSGYGKSAWTVVSILLKAKKY